jgi:hypothetical protein
LTAPGGGPVSGGAGGFVFTLGLWAYRVASFYLPWHYKTGAWIIEHRQVPRVDFWNFMRQGMEWIDAQWLFQVTAYGFGRLFGPAGPTLLTMTLVSLALAFLLAAAQKVPLSLRALAGLLFTLGINGRIICRPELLSCLFMAVMFYSLERARRGEWRMLGAVVAVQILWVNSQGLWPIGIGMVGAFVIDLGVESWRRGGID